jgi:hypothetical protein
MIEFELPCKLMVSLGDSWFCYIIKLLIVIRAVIGLQTFAIFTVTSSSF